MVSLIDSTNMINTIAIHHCTKYKPNIYKRESNRIDFNIIKKNKYT